MCIQGETVRLPIINTDNQHRLIDVDSCIAEIVRALNAAGILTVASCCGHGKRPGNVALADGRELIVAHDYKTARAIDKAFSSISDAACLSCGHLQSEHNPTKPTECKHGEGCDCFEYDYGQFDMVIK